MPVTISIKHQTKKIAGLLYLPDTHKNNYPLAIFCHGLGEDYSSFLHYGPKFNDKGIALLLFDFCGGGLNSHSDGNLKEMSCLTELEDLKAVLAYVKTLKQIDNNNIFLMGESQGGLVAAMMASKVKEEINGIILWYPAFNIPDTAKRMKEQNINRVVGLEVGDLWINDNMTIDTNKVITSYDGPVLLIHGNKDTIVPLDYSYQASQLYNHSKLHMIDNGKHGFDGSLSDEAYLTSIEFIKENMNYS